MRDFLARRFIRSRAGMALVGTTDEPAEEQDEVIVLPRPAEPDAHPAAPADGLQSRAARSPRHAPKLGPPSEAAPTDRDPLRRHRVGHGQGEEPDDGERDERDGER